MQSPPARARRRTSAVSPHRLRWRHIPKGRGRLFASWQQDEADRPGEVQEGCPAPAPRARTCCTASAGSVAEAPPPQPPRRTQRADGRVRGMRRGGRAHPWSINPSRARPSAPGPGQVRSHVRASSTLKRMHRPPREIGARIAAAVRNPRWRRSRGRNQLVNSSPRGRTSPHPNTLRPSEKVLRKGSRPGNSSPCGTDDHEDHGSGTAVPERVAEQKGPAWVNRRCTWGTSSPGSSHGSRTC